MAKKKRKQRHQPKRRYYVSGIIEVNGIPQEIKEEERYIAAYSENQAIKILELNLEMSFKNPRVYIRNRAVFELNVLPPDPPLTAKQLRLKL
ncbi:hypothetical protein KKD19_01205 [Patescibacteria group bacterium]|nr:hypothetical protein [Patescibacteria group bacterium]MBU4511850.1 hypothetical protein [Patescibacteria group bacterium]MCG2693476.1 hypothetical protein [Candidatus Parcubacteria bacterium]